MKTDAPYPFDHRAAVRHLRSTHAHMETLIARVGRFRMGMEAASTPADALLRSIVYQQLHASAASAILARIKATIGGGDYPSPEQVLGASEEALRGAGLSRQKIAAVRDLAAKTAEGVVPSMAEIEALDDEAIVARLTAVRGIGPWTVHMLLMFRLGRPDVLPTLDYGVRQGYRIAYRKRRLPTPRELARAGEAWRPYRSVASWYFWQAVRLEREASIASRS